MLASEMPTVRPQENPARRRLLLLDDDPILLQLLTRQLARRGYDVTPFETVPEAVSSATAQQYDGAVLDYALHGTTGLAVMEQLRRIDPTLTVVLLSGSIEVPEAVRAIRRGAEDVQIKPPSMDMLHAALERGLERTALQRSRRLMSAHVVDPYGVLDPSPGMQRVLRQVQQAAYLELPILLVGETGTGKRAIAEMAHQLSPRSGNPFRSIALRDRPEREIMAAFSAELARIDAASDATSRADSSSRSTLYLDDLGLLQPAAQQVLLGILKPPSAIGLIVSTRRDLSDDARSGRLLPALHEQLAVLPILVPALGERGAAAIGLLATRFLERLRSEVGEGPDAFAPAALEWLCNSRWPANIPQLRDVVGESFVRAIGEAQLETQHLTPSLVSRGLHAGSAERDGEDWSLHAAERRQILAVLGMTGNNRSQAARLLGITRTTLYKKMAECGVAIDATVSGELSA